MAIINYDDGSLDSIDLKNQLDELEGFTKNIKKSYGYSTYLYNDDARAPETEEEKQKRIEKEALEAKKRREEYEKSLAEAKAEKEAKLKRRISVKKTNPLLELTIDIPNSIKKQERRFWASKITFRKGVNLLFGGNGASKTSIIKAIQYCANGESHYDKIPDFDTVASLKTNYPMKVYKFSNSENNQRYNDSPQDVFSFVRRFESTARSEGQNVMQSVSDFLYVLENNVNTTEPVVILVDELDSGLDVIACRYLVKRLKKILKTNPNIILIMSFNQYEISKISSEWINVYTGEWEETKKTYDEYFSYLSKMKNSHVRSIDRKIKK